MISEEMKNNDEVFLSLKNIEKVYPNGVKAVYDFNLDIKKHEFIVLVGPSGCGKSTTLRMIGGLEEISGGELLIDGKLSNETPSKDRRCAIVFQSYALYPHMTVFDNIAFPLKINKYPLKTVKEDGTETIEMRKMTKEEVEEQVFKAVELLDLSQYLDRLPGELSGGQMQRVALGRAIVKNVPLFLMDEPLSNLDAKLRLTMRSEIVKLHNKIGATTIYVTHDQTEAMTMATKVVVMSRGFIQQVGTPKEVYNNPKNLFVARFIGSPTMNFFDGVYENGEIKLSDPNVSIPVGEDFIKRHDALYGRRIAEIKDLLENFGEDAAAYVKKIQSALADDKKTIVLKKKKSLFASLKNLFKKEEVKALFEDEKNVAEEKLSGLQAALESAHQIVLGIRPERVRIKHIQEGEAQDGDIVVKASVCELLGAEYNVHFNLFGKDVVAAVDVSEELSEGDLFKVELDEADLYAFDPITGDVI